MAKRAMAIQETNADAHFFYAADFGSAVQLEGITSAMFVVNEITAHLRRAIELEPTHAPALQFLGGFLAQLP